MSDLLQFLETTYARLAPSSLRNYRNAVKQLSKRLGRRVTVADTQRESVRSLIAEMPVHARGVLQAIARRASQTPQTEWHQATDGGPCSICGCPRLANRIHRLVDTEAWMVRYVRNRGGYYYHVVSPVDDDGLPPLVPIDPDAIAELSLDYWLLEYIRHTPLVKKSAYQMRRSCRLFHQFAGMLTHEQITPGVLSDWIAWLQQKYAPRTCRNHRTNVMAILRFAADRSDVAEITSRHVRRVKVPPPAPWAWTDDELKRLVEAALQLEGVLPSRSRLRRSQYALALIGAAYDSGLRKGDLFALEHEQIDDNGMVRLRQHKTSEPLTCQLSPHVVELVRAIPYPFPLRWTGHNKDYSALWREMCNVAGIRHGLTQQLRRTAATSVWESNPSLVQQFLGHRTADMWLHYVDRSRSAQPIRPDWGAAEKLLAGAF